MAAVSPVLLIAVAGAYLGAICVRKVLVCNGNLYRELRVVSAATLQIMFSYEGKVFADNWVS